LLAGIALCTERNTTADTLGFVSDFSG
jgi:hypothetical protein